MAARETRIEALRNLRPQKIDTNAFSPFAAAEGLDRRILATICSVQADETFASWKSDSRKSGSNYF